MSEAGVKMRILTFDIEDWFHILDNPATSDIDRWVEFPSRLEVNVERILAFCDRSGVKASFFILGWVAEKFPHVVKEIAERGHEIGCHSYGHQLVYTQTRAEFKDDLVRALDLIEASCGIRPKSYRAPGFSITRNSLWAFEVLVESGITIDCSVFPAGRAHGGLPVFPVGSPSILQLANGAELEIFPVSFAMFGGLRTVVSGGGYFRVLPEWCLRPHFERSDYVMTYFHPRDFDPGQPSIPGLNLLRRFKCNVGLATALSKLESLAPLSNFVPLCKARAQVNWSEVERVDILDLESD